MAGTELKKKKRLFIQTLKRGGRNGVKEKEKAVHSNLKESWLERSLLRSETAVFNFSPRTCSSSLHESRNFFAEEYKL